MRRAESLNLRILLSRSTDTTPGVMLSRMASMKRRRSSISVFARARSLLLASSCRVFPSRARLMLLNEATRAASSSVAAVLTRYARCPPASSPVAVTSASIGRVICLDANWASHTAMKSMKSVIRARMEANLRQTIGLAASSCCHSWTWACMNACSCRMSCGIFRARSTWPSPDGIGAVA